MRNYSWILLFTSLAASAQQSQLDTAFRSSNKIYVVVAVLSIVFIGLALYLVRLDKKISKIEKDNEA